MLSFLSWYLLISILGWITFPLAFRLFPALADRGYTLSRAFGLIFWGYIFWMLASLGAAQNDQGGLMLGLVIIGGLSIWSSVNRKSEILNWIGENRRVIITAELLFLLAFAAFAFFRSANPEIVGTEKPMELMFIQGIMHSPTFPPRDLWLSGYSISYYYFGYVMTSMMALFSGSPATVAFNLMLALIYGLSAVGAYGILYNILSSYRSNAESRSETVKHKPPILSSLLAPLFLLVISNVEGVLEVLHRRGIFWHFNADGSATSAFWTWLDMKELSGPPSLPLSWMPDRYLWWWRASRVVQDYDFLHNPLEAIDEFPAFSFLLGDLHPHILAIPFFLLAISVALNIFLGGFRGKINLYVGQLHISKTGFFLAAFLLGGMAFLNTWDILPVGALIVFGYAMARVRESGWSWERSEDVVFLGIPLVLAAYVMYLPFFIGFSSQAGGITPNFMYITRGTHLWVMWGTLFIPIFALIVHLLRLKTPADWKKGVAVSLGIVALLLVLMLTIGYLAYKLKPEIVLPILQGQQLDGSAFVAASFARRFSLIGSLITLLALLIPTLSFLFANHEQGATENASKTVDGISSTFVFLLIALGTLLILGPDYLYLRDNFGYRINTIFKFYYQAWILLSLAAAYGTAVLLKNLRGKANVIFSAVFVLVLVAGLPYTVLGVMTRTNSFQPANGFRLDDFERVQRETPDEAAAYLWLQSAPAGNIVEATGDPYSNYGRVSIFSGHPTILGWSNHEGQWRGNAFQGILAQRKQDVEVIYSTPDWDTTKTLLEQYNIRYVVVGGLERTSYRVNEQKLNNFLKRVFQQGNITIYEVP